MAYKANLEKTRNTDTQQDWYLRMQEFVNECGWDAFDKTQNFPIFATRQSISRFLETYEFFKLAQNIPGCFLEVGVASGSFLMAMAHFSSIFEGNHYTRRVIGFDTFEGFTEPSPEDLTSGAAHMTKGGLAIESKSILEKSAALYDENRPIGHIPKVELIKGDVSKTLPQYLEEHPELIVGILHMDVDLFQPTKDTLNLLKDRMPKGSMIIFDEPNHKDYPGETLAIIESMGLPNLRLRRLNISAMAAYAFIE
jgi:hypothetical protein